MIFLIHGFLAKHSLKERSEVNERANPAQKPARRRVEPPCGCTRPASSAIAPVSSPAS
ncbi:hypothetical protein F2Q69_00014025 [Brassica cretica]|uniref:Uncharacterized protein n=1 Tax=Brassica cretica TaxID=69181 RepID=A0A8S9R8G4_BRACR|nr:hypothetical protein F2Q69_00014025 [Brassica cretica]